MAAITIQGSKFEVPGAALDYIVVGYTLVDEGEVHSMRQTKLENLRNNFASTVKDVLNGAEMLTDEQLAELQGKFNEYAVAYKFGARAGGGGGVRLDPLTKEMLSLAREDFKVAYKAKFGENPEKALLTERAEELMNKKHDDYQRRARTILRSKAQVSADTLEAVGL